MPVTRENLTDAWWKTQISDQGALKKLKLTNTGVGEQLRTYQSAIEKLKSAGFNVATNVTKSKQSQPLVWPTDKKKCETPLKDGRAALLKAKTKVGDAVKTARALKEGDPKHLKTGSSEDTLLKELATALDNEHNVWLLFS